MSSLFLVEVVSLGVIATLILTPLSWIALYARGAAARDLLFWGAISVVIPVLGPVAAMVFAFRLKPDKAKRAAPESG